MRGCIGTFSSEKLSVNLPKYASIAAFSDRRFPKINLSEVPELEVNVSLLSNFEVITDPLDWTVGTHGIEIEFKSGGRTY